MAVLLTRTAVVRAEIETTYGTAPTLDNTDGLLVSEPDYTLDITTLERDIVRDSLSQVPVVNGRKLAKMTFSTEIRGNGKQQSGLLADAPNLTDLFRACGFAMTLMPATGGIGPYAIGDHVNPVVWSINVAALTTTEVVCYFVEVTTAGVSGTAQVTITSPVAGEGSAAAAITTATPKTLGTKGMTITPTFTGSLALGQRWVVWALPKGIRLNPISDGFESVTLEMNKAGVRHLMPGAFGTFDIEAVAGEYGKINWDFTGIYQAPTDAALATPTYETTLPPVVEFARLRLDGFDAVVERFTFDIGNNIEVRPSVNHGDGYIGTRLTSRSPEGGVDPEADTVANYDFWGRLAAATRMPFQMRVGTQVGNTIFFIGPNSQYTGLTYADRNDIMTYDAALRFAGVNGNDEFFIHLG